MWKNKKLTAAWVLFAVWLYGAWSVYTLWLLPILQDALPNKYMMELVGTGIIKNIVWVLPAFWLIRHFSQELAIPAKELFSLRREHLKYLLIAVFLAVLVIAGAVGRRHGFSLSPGFHPSQLIIVLFVGIEEEMVFRGFFLNGTLIGADTNFKKGIAVAVNAVMFLFIHFPIWIYNGVFITNFTNFGFITILVLSALFSFCTMRCRSLWVAVILHSFYDAMVFLFA